MNLFTGIGNEENMNAEYNFENIIPFDAFKNMKNLKILNFGFSKITFIGGNAFLGLDGLERLNLEYNLLVDLTGHAFQNLKNVKSRLKILGCFL